MSDLHKGVSVSPSAQRLAARYGVDPEKMEQIISGAVRESVPTFEPAVIHNEPATSGLPATEVEHAAPVVQSQTVLQTDPEWLKGHTFAEEVRAEQPAPAAASSAETATQTATIAATVAAVTAAAAAKEASATPAVEYPAPVRKVFSDIDSDPSAPNRVTIQSPSTFEKKEYREERKGLSPLAVILGVLGILAIVGIIWWLARPRVHKTHTTKQADSVATALAAQRVADSLRMADSLAQLHQDSLAAIAEAPPVQEEKPVERTPVKTPKHVKPKAKAVRAVKRPAASSPAAYTTSSGLSAQEHLADLRANGNHTAWVEAVNKNGSVVYKLHLTKQPALKKKKR